MTLTLYDIALPSARPYKAEYELTVKQIKDFLTRLINTANGEPVSPSELLEAEQNVEIDPRYLIFNMGRLMEVVASFDYPSLHDAVKELIADAMEADVYTQAATFTMMSRYHPASKNRIADFGDNQSNVRHGYLTNTQRNLLHDLHDHFGACLLKRNRFVLKELYSRFDAALNNEKVRWNIIERLADGLRVFKSIVGEKWPYIVEDGDFKHIENVICKLDRGDYGRKVLSQIESNNTDLQP